MDPRRFDVVIAGGGMVGASLAAALAGLPLDIAVIEAVPPGDAGQPSFDARTTALSRTSRRILEGIGAWPDVASAAAPIRRIHASEQGRFGTAIIDAATQGLDALGYVVENRLLGAALWARIGAAPRVTLLCPGRATAIEPGEAVTTVTVERPDGAPLALGARLVVVADGARSPLRGALGIDATARDYDQVAVIGVVAVSRPADGVTAYERFTPEGPLALLPIGGERFVCVLARAAAAGDAFLALDDRSFCALLQDAFGYRLGRFTRVGRRAAYPLALTRAHALTAPRAVLVGNAAHGLHPVAGQGYNLGLRDAAVLAELAADAVRSGAADPGTPELLAAYAAWRARDQRNVVAFTDGLVRLFGLPLPALGTLRGLSLALFDAAPGAKSLLARTAMGTGGRQTRLARGLPL